MSWLKRIHADNRAVTYVEMMVVVLIIAILADAATITLRTQAGRAHNSAAETRLGTAIKTAASERILVGQFPVGLRAEMAAGEPGLTFIDGNTFVADRVSVERLNGQSVIMRALSGSGVGYAWKRTYDGARTIDYRVRGTESALTNYAFNPSLESGTTNRLSPAYQCTDSTVTQDAPKFGKYALNCTNNGNPSALGSFTFETSFAGTAGGTQYYASAWARSQGTARQMYICLRGFRANQTSSGDSCSPPIAVPAGGQWKQLSAVLTVPANSAFIAGPHVYGNLVPVGNGEVWGIDGLQLHTGTTPRAYCDGDFPGGSWLVGPPPPPPVAAPPAPPAQAGQSSCYPWEQW